MQYGPVSIQLGGGAREHGEAESKEDLIEGLVEST